MKSKSQILKPRVNVWLFLGIALVFRYLSDQVTGDEQALEFKTLAELRDAIRKEPDAFIWHDLISDRYFAESELKRSLFHRREAIRILNRPVPAAGEEGVSVVKAAVEG